MESTQSRQEGYDPDGYGKFHDALRYRNGKASAHPCCVSGCQSQAIHWAWQHDGPSLSGVYKGNEITWGTDPATYAPMCASHHAMLDGKGTLTHCPNGHARATTRTAKTGNCVRCAHDRDNERRKERRLTDPEYRDRQRAKNRERMRSLRARGALAIPGTTESKGETHDVQG